MALSHLCVRTAPVYVCCARSYIRYLDDVSVYSVSQKAVVNTSSHAYSIYCPSRTTDNMNASSMCSKFINKIC